MQIKVNFKIFLFIVILYLTRQIELYGILMLFAFIHEIGHLIAGLILGFKIQSLNIMPFGVSVSFKVYNTDYNKKVLNGNMLSVKKMIIALAGPFMNFLVIAIVQLCNITVFGVSKEIIIYSNFLIAIFNLMPIYPLDGGRILKSILHIKYGLKKAIIYTNKISNGTVILLTAISSIAILYLKNIAIVLILMYLWYLIIKENKKFEVKMRIYEAVEST